MSNAYKCDRCNEFEESHPTVVLHVKRASMNAPYPPEADLCKDCRDSLREWYKGEGNDE